MRKSSIHEPNKYQVDELSNKRGNGYSTEGKGEGSLGNHRRDMESSRTYDSVWIQWPAKYIITITKQNVIINEEKQLGILSLYTGISSMTV